MSEPQATEAGVEALIERLRAKGVEAGRQEAARLVEAARAEAETLVSQARAESERLLLQARDESEALRRSGEAALELALRDAVLRLREEMNRLLAERLEERVRGALDDPELLGELLRGAARMLTGEGTLEGEIGAPSLSEEKLAALADLLLHDVAESAPELRIAPDLAGVMLRREGQSLVVELNDRMLCDFLFAQLQPRFRRIFEGARL